MTAVGPVVSEPVSPADTTAQPGATALGGVAMGDVDGDARSDLVVIAGQKEKTGSIRLLRQTESGELRDATAGSGLEGVHGALAVALGDIDNDRKRMSYTDATDQGIQHLQAYARKPQRHAPPARIGPVLGGRRTACDDRRGG